MKTFFKKYFPHSMVLLTALALSGCYTVIMHRHVDVAEETASDAHPYVSHQSECQSCHGESFEPYDYAFDRHETPFGETSRWVIYYENNIPWWYSTGTEPSADSEEATNTSDNTNTTRHYGRRRTVTNEQTTSGNSITPSVSSGSGAYIPVYNSSTAASSSSDSNQSNNNSNTNTQKKNSDNKKRDYGERRTTKKKDKQ